MNRRQIAFAMIWMWVSGAQAQTLGDIARQQQQKKGQHGATISNRVLTNDDLPHASSDVEQTSASNQKKPVKSKSATDEQPQTSSPNRSAEDFRQEIQKQKDEIAAIQQRIDQLQSTINYVQNNRNIYTNAPEYNEVQKRKQQQVDQLKGTLQQRQDELKDLQEQAREAGYGSAVYN